MDIKYWEGGLQIQEVEAIEKIKKAFTAPDKPKSQNNQSSHGSSLADQLAATGLVSSVSTDPMLSWKGYAGFRFVDARGSEGEFDLLIVTHCIILIIELKDWNHGKVESRDDKWFKNNRDMGRSPVSVTRNKQFLIQNKLRPHSKKFSSRGYAPQVHFCVVMCGNADLSGLTSEDKKFTLKLNDFLKLKNEGVFNQRFRPHPNSKTLLKDVSILDQLFFDKERLIQPKHIIVNGYKAKDLIFPHPTEVYKEYQAISDSKDQALLRIWDFSKLTKREAQTPEGRFVIVSREKEVLKYIKDHQYDLYKNCLRSLTSIQKDEVTRQYCELYELPPGHARFNEFIGKHGELFTEKDRLSLVKLLVAKFADLHEIKIAHRDLGDHSIWIDPGKQIALSNFISAYHQPLGTIGDFREQLSVSEGNVPAGMPVSKTTTPFQVDIYSLGLLAWHIIKARRIYPKSLEMVPSEINESDSWYAPVVAKAIDGNSFNYAKEFFDALKESEPANEDNYDFDFEELSEFNRAINHSRHYREDGDFIVETGTNEIYKSNGFLVKAWLNISPSEDHPGLARKVLNYCQQVSKLQSLAPPYLPAIHDYGLATKSSSLYAITEFIDGWNWNEVDGSHEQKYEVIHKLVSAVEHLHGIGLVHGDLHPENVKVAANDGEMHVYLLDIPDFSTNSRQSFNHRYSPEAIDGCTVYERDIFAVMRMSCELLGIEWGSEPEIAPALEEAVLLELEDHEYGFKDLTRFKDAIEKSQSGDKDEIDLIEISVRGDFDPITIYPDNGSLYVSFEKDRVKPSQSRITFKGIGGQISLIYSSTEAQFIIGFPPKVRSSVSFRDIDNSQLELAFGVTVKSSHVFQLGMLSQKVKEHHEFKRAIESVLQDTTTGADTSEVKAQVDLLSVTEEEPTQATVTVANEEIQAEIDVPESIISLKKQKSNQISISQLWQAVLDTETESHPFVMIQGEVQKADNSHDELIINYSSEFNVLDKFNSSDDIEAVKVEDEKDIRLGKVVLKLSGLNQVRLTKLTYRAYKLEEDDIIYFRSRQDRASYQKRRNALERLLNREGVVSNLIDYFDSNNEGSKAINYPVEVSSDDFSRYDRTDDHGNKISLNTQQREAFQKILQNGPLSLLQGPPGTGKTEFIAAFVHYLIEKQDVKKILLVSQSHEAVNTAAERIRKHCKNLETPLEVVRFSNREGAVSKGLKDVYSRAIVTEKRELFRAEIGYRVKALSQVLGLQPEYLAALIRAEFKLFRLIDQYDSFQVTDSSVTDEEKLSVKTSVAELEKSIRSVLAEKYDIHDLAIEALPSVKSRVMGQLDRDYNIRPNESKRARALVKISVNMLEVLETDRVNYDEFLARSRQLVTGTCVGIGQWHIGVAENQYDWVIIDEAARSIASELAIAMQSAKRVLLVGDHKQLPPLYTEAHKKALARKLGITGDNSELEELLQSDFAQAFESGYGEKAGAKLLTQYRMAEPIGNLVSSAFYDEELLTGKRVIPDIYAKVPESLKSTVTWIDTSSRPGAFHQKPPKGSSINNRCEADLIINLLREISQCADFVSELFNIVKENEPAIGIICMYAEQKKLLVKRFREEIWQDNFESLVNIGTVDSYQGKENRIIILSVTRNISSLSPGFLKSPNRINVAISRAMDKLVIVGSADMWRAQNSNLPLGGVLSFIEERVTHPEYQIITKDKV